MRMITLSVLAVVLSMTAGTALASASNMNTLTGSASNANTLTEPVKIHWNAVYDRSGNPRSPGSTDMVGLDSLYFKNFNVTNTLYGCPKSQVPNPTPANCRPAFSFLSGQSNVGMDPQGNYVYEVNGTSLRRHNTDDGTFTDYTISASSTCCKTDGSFLYVPVGAVVYKYTMTGTLVNQTTIFIMPNWYNFSVANDTVWCGTSTTLYGYACSRFSGGSIIEDATWDIGTGGASPSQVAWDGQYYYVTWAGNTSNTFKQFNADRTLSASGTINIDPRGPMCRVISPAVSPDSLYFKAFSGTQLMNAGKVTSPSPVNRTPMAFQYGQAVACMDPAGNYVYEAYNTNLRRFSTTDGSYTDYALSYTGGAGCATDGNFIYRPNGTTIDKYTMTGTYVNTTTINISCDAFSISVCGDTLWCTNDRYTGVNLYGFACSRFSGGTISQDAIWNVGTGTNGIGNVAFDGSFYYLPWIGSANMTFKRFDLSRTLYSTGTLSIDSRSVMCRLNRVSGVSEETETKPASAVSALEVAPNPFHRLARVSYALNKGDRVSLKMYNITGALVTTLANGYVEAGRHTVHFDGSKLAPGVYLLRLEAGSIRQTKKIVLQ